MPPGASRIFMCCRARKQTSASEFSYTWASSHPPCRRCRWVCRNQRVRSGHSSGQTQPHGSTLCFGSALVKFDLSYFNLLSFSSMTAALLTSVVQLIRKLLPFCGNMHSQRKTSQSCTAKARTPAVHSNI